MATYDTAIIGLGQTGSSCLKLLHAIGERIVVTDSREVPPHIDRIKQTYPDVEFHLGGFNESAILSAERVMLSQGIAQTEPTLARLATKGVKFVSDIEIFACATNQPILAITGSNGKSTVTSLVGHMAKACGIKAGVGGNLSPPALDLVMQPEPSCYVLEISNFQLETTHSLAAKVACILNLSPDHLDRYAAYADYIAAKQRIYQHCEIAVINRHDKETLPKYTKPQQTISFGLDEPQPGMFGIRKKADVTYLAFGDENLLPTSELSIAGQLHWQNALAALAIGYGAEWSLDGMLAALKNFQGLAHRCELVVENQGIKWINDSKGTNVGATIEALNSVGQSLAGKIIWLAGGLGKGADFSPLQSPVSTFVEQAIFFGEDGQRIAEQLSADTSIVHVPDLATAVSMAGQIASAGDAVLLSPACASFDMFENFAKRGERFSQLVKEQLTL